jgi:hypothetical protein
VCGVDWVKKWLVLRERLIEIAKELRKFPWMVGVVKQRPMNILHLYTVEVYKARDGSEACLSLNQPKAYCIQNGAVKEVKLDLEFSRYMKRRQERYTAPKDCWHSPPRRNST